MNSTKAILALLVVALVACADYGPTDTEDQLDPSTDSDEAAIDVKLQALAPYYVFINQGNQLCLTTESYSGGIVYMEACRFTAAQKFKITAVRYHGAHWGYEIRHIASNLCLEPDVKAVATNTRVTLRPCRLGQFQEWIIPGITGFFDEIVNVGGGTCMRPSGFAVVQGLCGGLPESPYDYWVPYY